MRKKSIIGLLGFISLLSCSYKNKNPNELLIEASKKLNEYNHIEYEVDYKIKIFDSNDTIIYEKSSVIFQKQPKDTILGYYSAISNQYESRIYDGNNTYLIIPEQQKILKESPKINGKKFTTNNVKKELIPFFLKAENAFDNYLKDAEYLTLSDSIINNKKVWKITVIITPVDDLTEIKRVIYLRKSDLFPIMFKKYTTLLNAQGEYVELVLNKVEIKSKFEKNFSNYYSLPKNYEIEVYQPPAKINEYSLKVGDSIPKINGELLNGSLPNIQSIFDQNRVVLLDFWYMACPPCIKSIPELQQIYDKYSKKGLITIGVNPIDRNKKDEMIKFMSNLNMTYPVLLTEYVAVENYRVTSFPTLFLIKDRKIEYIHIGYKDNFPEDFQTRIETLLR